MLYALRLSTLLHAGIGLLAMALGPTSLATVHAASYDPQNPATWTDWQLAAQLTVSCLQMGDVADAKRQAAAGIGGITLLGSRPPAHLAARLGAARRSASHGIAPFVMSDEEGGSVQRLRSAIYPLPSAHTMGSWRASRVHATARRYGARMRKLGVRMDLAPVSDLSVRGSYMAMLHRTFSGDPRQVARVSGAWRLGMHDAGVVSVIKHWPGHGSAVNSHTGPASVPPLATLEKRDMVPFNLELSRGARVVMVGHLTSRGLTDRGVPASQSPKALRYLRAKAGDDTVIITDSLTMSAASSSLGITAAQGAVRALRAGADWALVCNDRPLRAIDSIRDAIASGRLPRTQAVTSAQRIVNLKTEYGVVTR